MTCLRKNVELGLLEELNLSLTEGVASSSAIARDPALLSAFTFAPLTSVDVERSFSDYKYILSDRRHKFIKENFKNIL